MVNALHAHMNLLSLENGDLRLRLAAAEARDVKRLEQIGDLRVAVAHCDADKNQLRVELDELKRSLGR